MPEHADEFVHIRTRLVLGHDAGVDANEAGARQSIDPAHRQDDQRLTLFGPALGHHADPVELAVALVFELSAGDVRGVMGGTRRRRLHAERVTQQAHMVQGVAVALGQGEGQMGDARRRNHRQAGAAMQLVIQDRSQFMVAHLKPYEKNPPLGQRGPGFRLSPAQSIDYAALHGKCPTD